MFKKIKTAQFKNGEKPRRIAKRAKWGTRRRKEIRQCVRTLK